MVSRVTIHKYNHAKLPKCVQEKIKEMYGDTVGAPTKVGYSCTSRTLRRELSERCAVNNSFTASDRGE